MNGLHNCLLKKVGITICPEITIQKELTQNRLVKLPFQTVNMETSVLMIWHKDKWCSPVLKNFMEICNSLIKPG